MSEAASSKQLQELQDVDRELETILTSFETSYVWNYGSVKEGLHELYEKAKREQWNSTTQLPWDTAVDVESEIFPQLVNPLVGYPPYERLTPKEKMRLRHGQVSLQLSQFLHGEQGALIVASQLVGGVPWLDAKYYAGTQTMDEARHVEVFSRYINEKLEWQWPINENLKELLDATIKDSRWDFKYLGMQIVIEGLAMAAFGNLYHITSEPLLKELVHYVMRDESRHVAFGVLSLEGVYKDLNEREMREREEFTYEGCRLMRDRLYAVEVWQEMGLPIEETHQIVMQSEIMREFQKMLFSKVVPNCKRLGLLTPWLRERFHELDILRFEFEEASA